MTWATKSSEMLARPEASMRSSWNEELRWSFHKNSPILPRGLAVPETKIFFRSPLEPKRSEPELNTEFPSTSRKN